MVGPKDGLNEASIPVTAQYIKNIYTALEREHEPKKKFCKCLPFQLFSNPTILMQLTETGWPKILRRSHSPSQ